jgi:hypothetical protein
MLYNLYAILLSDVSYLRLARVFEQLREVLRDSVVSSRKLRMERERTFWAAGQRSPQERQRLESYLLEAVQTETYYLFGLALFCYMDESREFYRTLIVDVVTGGFPTPDRWLDYPMNLEYYYGNERVLWCVSMLVHFVAPQEKTDLLRKLTALGQRYRNFIKELHLQGYEEDAEKAVQARVKHVWAEFVTDLGGYEPKMRHQVIRYLHSVLIEPRENHLLVVHDPKRAQIALKDFIDTLASQQAVPPTKFIPFPSDGPDAGVLRRTLEDAIHACATLEGVAEAVSRLFGFHTVGGKDVTRYVAGLKSKLPGFRMEVHELRRFLQQIRGQRKVSQEQVHQLEKVRGKVEAELTLRDSDILQALMWYVVPFEEKLRSSMEQADRFLEGAGLRQVWRLAVGEGLEFDRFNYVLIDPTLLKDVLSNLCTNVRHGLRPDDDLAGQIRYGIERGQSPAPPPDTDQVDVLRFWVESPWKDHKMKENDTLRMQQLAIAQFGGKLKFESDYGRNLFRAELELISRDNTYQAWQRRFPVFKETL